MMILVMPIVLYIGGYSDIHFFRSPYHDILWHNTIHAAASVCIPACCSLLSVKRPAAVCFVTFLHEILVVILCLVYFLFGTVWLSVPVHFSFINLKRSYIYKLLNTTRLYLPLTFRSLSETFVRRSLFSSKLLLTKVSDRDRNVKGK